MPAERGKPGQAKLLGVNEVLKNLNKEVMKIKGRNIAGMLAAGAIVKKEAMLLTPVKEDNLRNSFRVAKNILPIGPGVKIENFASYALYQHENLEYKHTVGEAKFLEKAIMRNTSKIMAAIIRRVSV